MEVLQPDFTEKKEPQSVNNFSKIKKKRTPKKKRCTLLGCKKKLKLTDMNCKCKNRFCSLHRLPETHNCSWDPKNENEMNIYKEKSGLNQISVFSKMERI